MVQRTGEHREFRMVDLLPEHPRQAAMECRTSAHTRTNAALNVLVAALIASKYRRWPSRIKIKRAQ